MPTCRRCGRIGPHTCKKAQVSTAFGRPQRPGKSWSTAKQDLHEELKQVGNELGELMLAEDILVRNERLESPQDKARREKISQARTQLQGQIQKLHAEVKQSVQGEQVWRRTGVPPGYFSSVGLASTPVIADEGTQTDVSSDVPKALRRAVDSSKRRVEGTSSQPPPTLESPTKKYGVTFADAAEMERRRAARNSVCSAVAKQLEVDTGVRLPTQLPTPSRRHSFAWAEDSPSAPPTAHTGARTAPTNFEPSTAATISQPEIASRRSSLSRRPAIQPTAWTSAAAARWAGASVVGPEDDADARRAQRLSALSSDLARWRAEARRLEASADAAGAARALGEAKLLQMEATKLAATPLAARVRRLRAEPTDQTIPSTSLSKYLDGEGAVAGAPAAAPTMRDRARKMRERLRAAATPTTAWAGAPAAEDPAEAAEAAVMSAMDTVTNATVEKAVEVAADLAADLEATAADGDESDGENGEWNEDADAAAAFAAARCTFAAASYAAPSAAAPHQPPSYGATMPRAGPAEPVRAAPTTMPMGAPTGTGTMPMGAPPPPQPLHPQPMPYGYTGTCMPPLPPPTMVPPASLSAGAASHMRAAAHWAAMAVHHGQPLSSVGPSFGPNAPASAVAAYAAATAGLQAGWAGSPDHLQSARGGGVWEGVASVQRPVLPAAAAAAAWAAAHPPSLSAAPAAAAAVRAATAAREAAAATSAAVARYSAAHAAAHAFDGPLHHPPMGAAAPSAAAAAFAAARSAAAPFAAAPAAAGGFSAEALAAAAGSMQQTFCGEARFSDVSDYERAQPGGATPSTGGWSARHAAPSTPGDWHGSSSAPYHTSPSLGAMPGARGTEALLDEWLLRARHRAYGNLHAHDALSYSLGAGVGAPLGHGIAGGAHAAMLAGLQQAQQILSASELHQQAARLGAGR